MNASIEAVPPESFNEDDLKFMDLALSHARLAPDLGEVPVGAVVVYQGEVISVACNRRSIDSDPTGHAELIAMREAAKHLGDWRLEGCTVYVTLEPCAMCAGTMVQARIQRCVFGCSDPKAGYMGSLYDLSCDTRLNHRFAVTRGVRGEESSTLLRDFFRSLRAQRKQKRATDG